MPNCSALITVVDESVRDQILKMAETSDASVVENEDKTIDITVYNECDWLDLWDLHDAGKILMEEKSRNV